MRSGASASFVGSIFVGSVSNEADKTNESDKDDRDKAEADQDADEKRHDVRSGSGAV
jgi:hypothetical protein